MATVSIGTDYIAATGQQNTSNAASTSSKFFDYLAMGASAAGPTMYQSFLAAGNESAATISAATCNAVYGSALSASGSSSPYMSTGSLGTSYSGAYYTGGSPMYSTTGTSYSTTTGSTDLSSSVESILTDTASSQAYLIGIQAQLGQQQSTFTAVSNALSTKYSMEKSAIQNFRV